MAQSEQVQITTGWHLRKEINLTHIFTTIALVIAILKFGYSMDTRITVLEANSTNRQAAIVEIKDTIKRMDSKIDRLIERK